MKLGYKGVNHDELMTYTTKFKKDLNISDYR